MDEIFTSDLKRRIKELFETCEFLQKENAELKKDVNFKNKMQQTLEEKIFELEAKLDKKRIPPKGTPVRSKETGIMGYSTGTIADGVLWITEDRDCENTRKFTCDWEEIEIKVKE